ncbi:MAG: MFS transporter [Candidatus Thermoplasmatota archaeon]|jgi:EmrB/QacA subfamily drug resistance transporter|nr:MFS transporter [Candidatus Thermoplasmatota archaeon]
MAINSKAKASIVVMALTGTLIMYVETMITPALPILSKFFDSSYDSLSWVITAYLISGTASAAIFGKLGDIYGKKKIFLILSLAYAVAISFGGFATTLSQFILVRTVQGMGMGMIPVAFALLNDELPKKDLPLAQGIISATFTVGASLGLVIGAWITQNYDWQWSYHSAIPVAFGLLIAAFFILQESPVREKERIDFGGVFLLITGVVSVLLLLSEGQYWGWVSTISFSMGLLSLGSFVMFILYESTIEEPFINLKLLKIKNVFMANIGGLLVSGGMFYLFFTIPLILQDPSPTGFGRDILSSGLAMVPTSLLGIVFAPIGATVVKRRGPKTSILVGTVVMLFAFILLYLNRGSVMAITEDAAFIGAGTSFVFVGMINMVIISTPKEEVGQATGMNTVFRNIGSSISPAIAGSIESQVVMPAMVGSYPSPFGNLPVTPIFGNFPSPVAFDYIYFVGFITLLLSLIFTVSMKKVRVNESNEVV